MLYMVTFTINILQMLAYIPYMDPMGIVMCMYIYIYTYTALDSLWRSLMMLKRFCPQLELLGGDFPFLCRAVGRGLNGFNGWNFRERHPMES